MQRGAVLLYRLELYMPHNLMHIISVENYGNRYQKRAHFSYLKHDIQNYANTYK